ncbi:hypothetical protein PAECIP111802_04261 [Paenibacillus allorhizosphaerae]|uniref:Transposase n=1 Tax=Paenibacillus allorhizosphaerae TaxID=2849866 RepID=A0ABN7TNH5_9BACL|nr:hypothetical protein PAECIP111802_04261 [Paenibacillus allorhizosphaerae]
MSIDMLGVEASVAARQFVTMGRERSVLCDRARKASSFYEPGLFHNGHKRSRLHIYSAVKCWYNGVRNAKEREYWKAHTYAVLMNITELKKGDTMDDTALP